MSDTTAPAATAAVLAASAFSLPAAPASAQSNRAELSERLVSPKQLLDHAEELKLTDTQIAALRKNKRSTREDLRALRADLEEQTKQLIRLLDAPDSTRHEIMAVADRVMDTEKAIKRRQLTSVLDARATLDDRQNKMVLDYLGTLREQRRERRKKKLRRQLERLEKETP